MALAIIITSSCSSNDTEGIVDENDGYTSVTFNVTGLQISLEQTRASSISDAFPMLELALYKLESDGSYSKCYEASQDNSNATYGTVTFDNVKCGSYKLVAIGHNDSSHPNIDDPTDIAFTNYPNAYGYTGDINITKATSSVDVPFTHKTARLRFQLTGYFPDEVEKLEFTIEGASNTFNAITGLASSKSTRVVRQDITASHRASKSFSGNVYTFLDAEELSATDSYINVKISGLDASENPVDPKSYNNVPVKIGYTTNFSGVFFEYGNVVFNMSVNTNWGTLGSIEL